MLFKGRTLNIFTHPLTQLVCLLQKKVKSKINKIDILWPRITLTTISTRTVDKDIIYSVLRV